MVSIIVGCSSHACSVSYRFRHGAHNESLVPHYSRGRVFVLSLFLDYLRRLFKSDVIFVLKVSLQCRAAHLFWFRLIVCQLQVDRTTGSGFQDDGFKSVGSRCSPAIPARPRSPPPSPRLSQARITRNVLAMSYDVIQREKIEVMNCDQRDKIARATTLQFSRVPQIPRSTVRKFATLSK
jgi:hypothetical protein